MLGGDPVLTAAPHGPVQAWVARACGARGPEGPGRRRGAEFCPQGWPRALVLLSLGRLPKGVPHSLRLTAGWGGQGEERGRLLPAPYPRHNLEVFPTRCLPFCPWACGAIVHTLTRHRRPSRGTGRGPSGGSGPLACVTGRLGRVSSSRRGRTRPSGPCCAPEEAPRVRSLGPGGVGGEGSRQGPPLLNDLCLRNLPALCRGLAFDHDSPPPRRCSTFQAGERQTGLKTAGRTFSGSPARPGGGGPPRPQAAGLGGRSGPRCTPEPLHPPLLHPRSPVTARGPRSRALLQQRAEAFRPWPRASSRSLGSAWWPEAAVTTHALSPPSCPLVCVVGLGF